METEYQQQLIEKIFKLAEQMKEVTMSLNSSLELAKTEGIFYPATSNCIIDDYTLLAKVIALTQLYNEQFPGNPYTQELEKGLEKTLKDASRDIKTILNEVITSVQ